MAHYRKVESRIWNDEKFRALSERGKLVFLFEITHPHLTMIGAMRATVPGLAAELGMDQEGFTEAFQESIAKGMVKHDPGALFLWLPNFLKFNRPESPNVVKAWPHAYDLLPECALKVELLERLREFVKGLTEGFREAFAEGFNEALAKSMANQKPEPEQDPERELEGKGNARRARSRRPCPSEPTPSEEAAIRILESLGQSISRGAVDVVRQQVEKAAEDYGGIDEGAAVIARACRVAKGSYAKVHSLWIGDAEWRKWAAPASFRGEVQ